MMALLFLLKLSGLHRAICLSTPTVVGLYYVHNVRRADAPSSQHCPTRNISRCDGLVLDRS
jgi:hypothetical protein